jgi:TonB family protein
MRIIPSSMLILSLVIALSPCSTQAQDKHESSPAYEEAWKATDLNLRVEKLNQAILEKPDLVPAHYYLGLTLSQLKRYDEAIAAYRRLIQIPAPSTAPATRFLLAAHYEIGKASLAMSRYEAAATEYRWLKERSADELALFLSDLFPKDAAEQHQVPLSPPIAVSNGQDATGEKDRSVVPMNVADKRIVITYKEKARYTEIARMNRVVGTVALSVVFTEDGRVTDIRVVRGLADGLTRKAIEAAQKIRFQPATRDGKAQNVRGQLEFTYNLF